MPATAKPETPGRTLVEWSAASPSGKVDRDARTIFGVRVLGHHSRNSHGHPQATNGTEYTRACMEAAVPLYEGCEVMARPGFRHKKGSDDDAEPIGVLRNVRVVQESDGPCVRADLRYYETHPQSGRLLEEAEHNIGGLGLSHDAKAARERFDRGRGTLVIESLASVAEVTLVRKPGSNRSLFEGTQPVATTLRKILEGRTLSAARQKWSRWLLEDDMAPPMDAPVEAPPAAEEDPDEALWAGFKTAIMAILDSDATPDEKAKKIAKYIKAHAKITAATEPSDAPSDDKGGDAVKEGCEAPADKKESELAAENAALKRKLAVRELLEGLKVDDDFRTLLEGLPAEQARTLVERERKRPAAGPKSAGHPPAPADHKVPGDPKSFAASLR